MSVTAPTESAAAHAHASYVRRETFVAVLINSVLSAVFTFLVFGRRDGIALWGLDGLALDFVPQTFIITLATVVAATVLTRKRVRARGIERLAEVPTRLPSNVVVRAVLLAALATLLLGGAATVVSALMWEGPVGFIAILVPKIVYGAAVAAIVAPFALRAALKDA